MPTNLNHVTTNAMIKRLNRVLARDYQKVCRSREPRGHPDFGEYYLLDTIRNIAIQTDVDVEALAREVGALKRYETLLDGEQARPADSPTP